MGFTLLHRLPSAEEVRKEYPLSEELTEIKAKRDAEIKAIFKGESKKFLLVIGPCSADHEDPVLEYCHRLKEVAKEVEDRIFIVPRRESIPTNPEPRGRVIRVCFISRIRKNVPI